MTHDPRMARLIALIGAALSPAPGIGRIALAIGFGVLCHGLFAVAVLSMVVAMFFGMSESLGQVPWPWALLANLGLIVQFPLAHSVLLTGRGEVPSGAFRLILTGRVAEIGPVHEVINHPAHPYTAGLMACIPDMGEDRDRLHQIDGAMPRLNAIPQGCAYNPRCDRVFDRCYTQRPDLLAAGATRAACWLHDGQAQPAAAVEVTA